MQALARALEGPAVTPPQPPWLRRADVELCLDDLELAVGELAALRVPVRLRAGVTTAHSNGLPGQGSSARSPAPRNTATVENRRWVVPQVSGPASAAAQASRTGPEGKATIG